MTFERQREEASDASMSALVLARLGRIDEARSMATKALGFERGLHARGSDDQLHKTELALALVASAWVEPAQAKPLLNEARAALDSLPAEARTLRTVRWTDGLIGDAGRAAH